MTQDHTRRGGLEPDTSERLYTADDLASYTASRLRPEAPLPTPPHGDPLTDPMPGTTEPAAQAEPAARRRTRCAGTRCAPPRCQTRQHRLRRRLPPSPRYADS